MRHTFTFLTLLATLNVVAQVPTARRLDRTIAPLTHSKPPSPGTEKSDVVLWSEDFEDGIADWTVNTVTGPVDWALTSTGNTGGYTPGPLESTTGYPTGSWIFADSDLNGTPGTMENTTITSPAITGLDAYSFMLLRFEQSFRQLNDDETTVEVSGNGGADWTIYPVNTDVAGNQSTPGAPAAQTLTLNISEALAGGASDIRIRFRWLSTEGYTYSWQVDDIRLVAAPANNLTLIDATHAAWDLTESDFSGLPYTIYSGDEVRELKFRARLTNNGSAPQTNVRLLVDIDGPGASDATLTSSSITLDPGEVDSLFITGYTPPVAQGTFLVDMSITQDEVEDDPSDNTSSMSFDIDPYIFARDEGALDGIYDNEGDEYELGNWFNVVTNETLYAVDIGLSDDSDPGAIITAVLYDDELTQLSESEEYTVQAADLNNGGEGHFITLPLIDPQDLINDNDYFVAVRHYGGADNVVVGTSGVSIPQTSLIYDTPAGDWLYVTSTPMVRMNFDPTVGLGEHAAGQGTLQALPTVFNDCTQVVFQLDDAQQVTLALHDGMGRLVRTVNMGRLPAGMHTWTLEGDDLAPGTYALVLSSDERTCSVRVVRTAGR